jgi:hypothetical protein
MQHELSASVVVYDPVFADGARLASAGFLAGYRGATRDAHALDLRQFVPGVLISTWLCSRCAALTSKATPGPWKSEEGPERQSPAACAPWPGSTATRKKKGCWLCPRPSTFAVPAWTTNRTPSGWTETRSVPCSSPPGWDPRSSTRSSPSWRSTGCGSQKQPARTSKPSAWNEVTEH